jgi:hypothetical protein
MDLKHAFAGGGWLVAAVLSVSAFFAGEQAKPLENVVEPTAEEAARSVGVDVGRCPAGWDYNEITEHMVVESCIKGSIVVVLYPREKIANYGRDTALGGDAPAPEIPCLNIPDWPADRCAPQ